MRYLLLIFTLCLALACRKKPLTPEDIIGHKLNIPAIPDGPSSGYIDSSYTFSTSATDPDGNSVAYRFAWGDRDTSGWTPFVPSDSSASKSHSWSTTGTYYIKAQAKDINNKLSNWSNAHQIKIDTVGVNNPPYTPGNLSPDSGATNQSINADLSWTGGDPDGDAVTYDVYFGTSTPPQFKQNVASETYDPGTMNYTTHYYWKIVAKDSHNDTTAGPVWDFTTSDSVKMVYVSAGWFTMGSDSGEGDPNEEPEHQVYLDAYYIDKYEMTNTMFAVFLSDGNGSYCNSNMHINDNGGGNYSAQSGYEDHPVVYVNWYGAKAYCEWRGGRLPTEAEWEKAARGSVDERTYPWGEGIDSTYANYSVNVGTTTPVWSYEKGKSPYGCYDMAGNVWEWCNDWYSSSYYSASPDTNPQGPSSGNCRVIRGGSWGYDARNLRCADRGYNDPDNGWYDDGFRCARAP